MGEGINTQFLQQANISRIHCVGIGGIGVSGLAELLLLAGFAVSGSDATENAQVRRLRQLGANIALGHDESVVAGADCLIYTRAILPDNPELLWARDHELPCYSRGEFLAAMVADHPAIVVAGSHGKSTTSAWVAHTLQQSGQPVNAYLGAIPQGGESPVVKGACNSWVIESDESDGSCFLLSPSCLVVTNLDRDHLETYAGSLTKLQDRFVDWINSLTTTGGVSVLCADDPGVAAILPRLRGQIFTYGFAADADYAIVGCEQRGAMMTIRWTTPDGEEFSGELRLPGRHNALNALAAWVACVVSGNANGQNIIPNWEKFIGVKRRMSVHGEIAISQGQALIIEDYGHHPSEMQATLTAVQQAWPEQRILMLFQPHRYSRTQQLLADFVAVLQQVDDLFLLPIYAAGELPIATVCSQALAEQITDAGGRAPILFDSLHQAELGLREHLRDGDVLLLQGAGDVGELATMLCANGHSMS